MHAPQAPPTQQLSVDQIFVMFDPENQLIRYAMSSRTGAVHGEFRVNVHGGEEDASRPGTSQGDKQKPDPGSVSPAAVRGGRRSRGRPGYQHPDPGRGEGAGPPSELRSEVTSQVDSTNKLQALRGDPAA